MLTTKHVLLQLLLLLQLLKGQLLAQAAFVFSGVSRPWRRRLRITTQVFHENAAWVKAFL